MRHFGTKMLLSVLINLMSIESFAYDIEVSNSQGIHIFYNYINDGQELEVVNGWDYYSADVVGLVIPEEVTYMNRRRKVTSIGDAAFYYCNNLTFVNLPNSITRIGARAFIECTKLSYIAIPNSVISIEEEAFRDCEKLASVDIGSGVNFIGPKAFYGCKKLTSVVIPEGVSSISNSIFYKCKELTSATIPNSVTLIGESSFEGCTALSSITIPNNVTSIGVSAFKDCSRLSSITIPRSVTSIGKKAFEGINISTVVSKIKNPFTITGKASDNRTFSKNTFNNATLYVPAGTINKYKAKDGWKDFLFIEENSEPGDDSDIVINEENFPDENFRAYLMSQSYGKDGIITEEEIKNVVKIHVEGKKITNLKGIEYFTALTSLYCSENRLTNLDVSKNAALTGLYCSVNQLTSLDVSKNTVLTELWCYNNQLTSIDVSKNTALTELYCFDNKIKGEAMDALVESLPNQSSAEMRVIDLSNTSEENVCTSIQVKTAKEKGWRVLTSSGEDYIGSNQTLDENLSGSCGDGANYTYEKENHTLTISGKGAIYDYDNGSNKAPWSYYADEIQKVEIESGITPIGYFAFYKCSGITSLSIPATVRYIGSSAFEDCTSLTSLSLNEGLLSLGGSAFEKCSGLQTLSIPSTVNTVSIKAFASCSGITKVYCFAENVPETDSDAFDGTPTEKSTLYVPVNSVEAYRTSWPWSDFQNIVGIESTPGDDNPKKRTIHVAIAGTLSELISNDEKYQIEELTLTGELNGSDIRLIRDMAGIDFGDSGDIWDDERFWDINTSGILKDLDLSNAIIVAGGNAYYGRSRGSAYGEEYHTKDNIVSDYMFCKCKLKSLVLPNSVTSIGERVFKESTSLTSVNIPNSVASIGYAVFQNCSNLETIISEIEHPFVAVLFNSYEKDYYSTVTLIIPKGTKAAYQATEGWNMFANIVEAGEDNPVGIMSVKQSDGHNDEYYDLIGRKVHHPQKGLYIRNGKKVIVR